jgi:transcriptional regulator with XRE-family HTH domain
MELKIARQIAGLTQRELADRSGVATSTLSLLESGKRPYDTVGYADIMRIAAVLGVDPDLLFPVAGATRGRLGAPRGRKRKPRERSAQEGRE